MDTLTRDAAMSPASYATLTADRLMDAPLDELLAEAGAEIVASRITDRTFFGAVVQRTSGELYLSMPTGRSELEHDMVARYLLAQVFDVGLPELSEPFVTSRM